MAYGSTATTPATSTAMQNENLQEIAAEPVPDDEQETLAKTMDVKEGKTGVRHSLKAFYERNFGLVLVFLAQTCGSVMNTAAKLLATGYETKFHAMQIIFIRMLCTTILGMVYMAWYRTPDFPLGQKGIRGLLVLRGVCGFIGLFGLYCVYTIPTRLSLEYGFCC